MKITIHRGAAGQGGNCVELCSGKSRILLDYGLPQGVADPYAAELNIPGLYDKSPDPLLALIISHTHLGHYGGLLGRPLNPGVKVYMSEIMEDVARITSKMPRKANKLPLGIYHFRRNQKFIVGRFVITPFLMDHSSAESFAFLVESEGKRVVYTGHFRDHGPKAAAFKQFLAADIGALDALITEGAQADIDKGPAEQEVMDQAQVKAKGLEGPLFVMCAGQDVGMLTHLALLAFKTRRFLVVDGYSALVLERVKLLAQKHGVDLKVPGLDTPFLRVLRSAATQRVYAMSEYAETFRRMRDKLYGWDWVRDNLDRLVIPVRANSELWAGEEIKDLRGGTLLYSAWEDYGEEPGMRETLDWFRAQGLAEVPAPLASHAYFSAIRKLVENKKPRFIVPVNTAHTEKFADTFGKRVKALQDGDTLDLA